MFQVIGIDHVVFRVRNLARMVEFWERALGCPVERRQEALGLVHLRVGRTQVDLLQAQDGEPVADAGTGNVAHLCLRIEPWDPSALRSHFQGLGVEATGEDFRFGADGVGPSLYLQDPEGNTIELKGPPAPAEIPKS